MTDFLCTIFFVSGASALIFETLWFRQAGLAFGNSIWASSLVLSGFMGGLALGSALAARYGTRLVADLTRTERFCRELLGFAARQPLHVGHGVPLAFGFDLPSGSSLSSQKSENPRAACVDHFCVAVEADPDVDKLAEKLELLGLQGRR